MKAFTSASEPASAITASAVPPALRTRSTVSLTPSLRSTAISWWWVRHAPVREDGGCIYGQSDIGCDTSDRVVFDAVGRILPRNAAWFASNLKRTHQTAAAIWAAGFPQPHHLQQEPDLAEQ